MSSRRPAPQEKRPQARQQARPHQTPGAQQTGAEVSTDRHCETPGSDRASRTHRERKELYIKALEQEVLRLKENFSTVSRDKDSIAEENRQLKQLLAQHGISWPGGELGPNHNSAGYTSSGSISGSYAPGSTSYSPPPHGQNQFHSASPPDGGRSGRSMVQQQAQPGVDYDQAGIDFVLTYANPANPSKAYMSPPPQ